MSDDRKPPARMESREPKSIRFTPTEWEALSGAARQRGLEPAVFARMLTMYGFSISQAQRLTEEATWIPGIGREGSQRIRKF